MEDGYKCVFSDDPCPVRREFKLKPENLLRFCQICPTQKPRAEAYMPEIVARLVDLFFREKELLRQERLQLIKMLVEKTSPKLSSE